VERGTWRGWPQLRLDQRGKLLLQQTCVCVHVEDITGRARQATRLRCDGAVSHTRVVPRSRETEHVHVHILAPHKRPRIHIDALTRATRWRGLLDDTFRSLITREHKR
jgi:hypothetical protein